MDGFMVYGHGFNGDFTFFEPWGFEDTLPQAKKLAEKAMAERGEHTLSDGKTPTLQWMEVFGPGIEESLGLEASEDGTLAWEGR